MSGLKKLASQTLIYGVGNILIKVINLLLTPWLSGAEHISKADFGIFGQVYAFIAMINIVITFGMETTFFRFIQDSEEKKKIYSQAFIWVAFLASLFLIFILFFNEAIASSLGYEGRGNWILLLGTVIFMDGLCALPLAKLRQEEKAGRFVSVLLSSVVVNIVLNYIFIIVLELGLTYVFIANVAASAVKFGFGLIGNLPSSFRPDWKLLRSMLGYAFFIMIAGFAGIMNETFDRATIPLLWPDGKPFEGVARTGEEMNGIYAANYRVAVLISLAIQAFRYAAEPFFFNRSKDKDSPQTFAKIFHYFIVAALIGFLVIGSFSKEIVSFNFWGLTRFTFIDERYWSGLTIVPILLMAYVFSGAYLNMSIWYKITKQVRFAILFTGVGATITLVGNFLFIPSYGYYASAWATLICYVVMSIMVYVIGQKYYPIPYKIGRALLYGGIFVIGFLLNQQIGPSEGSFIAFTGKAVICLLCIGGMLGLERFIPVFNKVKQDQPSESSDE